jgi:hypothetical protein
MLALGRVDATPVDVLRVQELMKENITVTEKVGMLAWKVSKNLSFIN